MKSLAKFLYNNFLSWLLWYGTFYILLTLIIFPLISPLFLWPPNWKCQMSTSHLYNYYFCWCPLPFSRILDGINHTPPALISFSNWTLTFPTTYGATPPRHIQSTLRDFGNKNSTCPELKPQSLLSLYHFTLESQGTTLLSHYPPNLNVLQSLLHI